MTDAAATGQARTGGRTEGRFTDGMSSPGPHSPLIQSKLTIPTPDADFVDRLRLHEQLASRIAAHRVVVVSATAGSGKTTAVAAAVQRLGFPVGWLSVDHTDAAAGRLLVYLEAALTRCSSSLEGVATDALAAGIPHAEAAGLLAEASAGDPAVLVLDDLERLETAAVAWAVIEALIRYAPASLHIVLVSRRELPIGLFAIPGVGIATVGETELAFTSSEARDALALLGKSEVDPEAAVQATGGWVTGVLFEAWRSSEHGHFGGEADPLNGYLSAHILGQLEPIVCDFLITTSILDEVTASRADALGLERAGERLTELRAAHLPVTWGPDGNVMRCHSRFREYLLERLERRGYRELRELRLAHARSLVADGRDEDAAEEYLRAGAPEAALPPARRSILKVIERLDIDIADRWLDELSDVAGPKPSTLTAAELMVAIARDDFRRCVRIADQLQELGYRDEFGRQSEHCALLMAWSYFNAGRADDVRAVLKETEPGPMLDAAKYGLRLMMNDLSDPQSAPAPELTGSSIDLLIYAADYGLGRLRTFIEAPASRWMRALMGAWRIAALRATGHTREALELYEEARNVEPMPRALATFIWPEILIDLGRAEEAHSALAIGRRLASESGSGGLVTLNLIAEVKARLRLDRDTVAARAVLDSPQMEHVAQTFDFAREIRDTFYGLALLLDGEPEAALARLRRAVESMVARHRILELPTAAAYLAEAEWQTGDEQAADAAADLALRAAEEQGSNHMLLQALGDVPAVVSRRLDSTDEPDTPWHALARTLLAQRVPVPLTVRANIELREFGERSLYVNGAPERPRIAKSYELLSILALSGPDGIRRAELLDILFDGRATASAGSYLRTALQWLRKCLPEGAIISENGVIRIDETFTIVTESARFESRLVEAARLRDDERLAATLGALAVFEKGEYLPGSHSEWAEKRGSKLADLANDARCEAAELALVAGRYDEAHELTEQVLKFDPYRENAWRFAMRIAEIRGDQQGLLRAFIGCENALRQINTSPSAATRRVFQALRR